jgi:hypothetical protein
LPHNGGKFGCFYIETIPEAIQKLRFLNSSICKNFSWAYPRLWRGRALRFKSSELHKQFLRAFRCDPLRGRQRRAAALRMFLIRTAAARILGMYYRKKITAKPKK